MNCKIKLLIICVLLLSVHLSFAQNHKLTFKFVNHYYNHEGILSIQLKNNMEKRIIIEDDLRGSECLNIVISETGILYPSSRWVQEKPEKEEEHEFYGSDFSHISLAPGEKRYWSPEPKEDWYDLDKNAVYYSWWVIRDVPDHPRNIRISSPVECYCNSKGTFQRDRTRIITRSEIPDIVYSRFLHEIKKIKQERPTQR